MKTCITCRATFEVSPEEVAFLEKVAPVAGGRKFAIPEPIECPDCRLRARVAQRNEQYFYARESAKSGKPLISLYSPKSPYKIVSHEEWWSEDWDGESFGRDYDFSRPFFDQFQEMQLQVPRVSLVQVNNENCPYTTGTGYCRNCYLINSSENCEDCFYGKLLQSSRDVMDSAYIYDSEQIYEGFNLKKCYNCRYVYYSQNCYDCSFSDNLRGCSNCFLCTNLNAKEYHFMNRQVSKEEYAAKVADAMKDLAGTKAKFDELRRARIYKFANVLNCENSTGDFLTNCKNCTECFDANDSEDCKYVTVGVNVKDLMDCSNMYLKPELNYQVMGTIETYNVIFSVYVFHSQNAAYSQFCFNSKNLFGCAGLRRKEYCILNKQYSKEEYEALVPRVIEHMKSTGEWGRFFPVSSSPFPYNDSVAYLYLPLSKEEALAKGFAWRDPEAKDYAAASGEVLACSKCGRNYKLIPQEVKRLRDMGLPDPTMCPDCRHWERMGLRNPHKIYSRGCGKCGAPVATTFAPDRPEKIYCEKCYLAEVY